MNARGNENTLTIYTRSTISSPGKLNIKARQTRAYRVYARSTRGMNAMSMALSRRWLDVYLFLLLHHTLCHDARPIPHTVHRHYDGLKGLPLVEINRLAEFAEEEITRATNPLIAALRVAWLMREAAKQDRIHRYVTLFHRGTHLAIMTNFSIVSL